MILSPDLGHECKGHRVPSRSWSCPVVCLVVKEVDMSFTKTQLWLIVFYFPHLKFIMQLDRGKSRWSIWSLELEERQGTSGTFWHFHRAPPFISEKRKILFYLHLWLLDGCFINWTNTPAESLMEIGQCMALALLLLFHPRHVVSFFFFKGMSLN